MGRAPRRFSRGLGAKWKQFPDVARRHLPKQIWGDFDGPIVERPLFEHISQQRKLQWRKHSGPVESQLGRYFHVAADVLRQHHDRGQFAVRGPSKHLRFGFPAWVPCWRFTAIFVGTWLPVDSRSERPEFFRFPTAKSAYS